MATPIAEAAGRMVSTARTLGVKRDSLERFLRAGYAPQPKQFAFHAAARSCDEEGGPTEIGFGGARGPGKSHAGLAQIAIDDCQRAEGLKFLFLRKVGKAARESFEDLRIKVLANVPHSYRSQAGVLEINSTRSRIVLGHFNAESDIDNYLGIEYDGALIEESNQISATKQRQIKTSIRSSKEGWRPRIYHTFNPGGVGHQHTKQKFIQPWRDAAETSTRFIFATYRDNRFLNQDYEQSLNELTGWLRAAWRDGDWDIAAGQFFTTWHHDSHVIKPFVVPFHWSAWACLDYGFTHPTAVYLLRENDGIVYVTGEYVRAKKLPAQHAPLIKEMFLRQGLDVGRVRPFVAGQDAFDNKGDEEGKTIAQQYDKFGIHLERANMSRISRAGELLMLLGDVHAKKPIGPRIQIFNTCPRLVECLPALQHDPHRPEDVLKWDIDDDGNGGDDPYDSVGMGLLVRRGAQSRPAVAGKRQAASFVMR